MKESIHEISCKLSQMVIAAKGAKETMDVIVARAREAYPKLPTFVSTEWLHGEKVLGIDKNGRRWVIYGRWIVGGTYDITTIIRETRRNKAFDWLINGQANKNCKNVWGCAQGDLRIVLPEIDKMSRAWFILAHK